MILPRNGCFYVEWLYQLEVEKHESIDQKDRVLGIDQGVDNWLTWVSNVGTSLIVDGKHLN